MKGETGEETEEQEERTRVVCSKPMYYICDDGDDAMLSKLCRPVCTIVMSLRVKRTHTWQVGLVPRPCPLAPPPSHCLTLFERTMACVVSPPQVSQRTHGDVSFERTRR